MLGKMKKKIVTNQNVITLYYLQKTIKNPMFNIMKNQNIGTKWSGDMVDR